VKFFTPPVFISPAAGDPVGISWRCLMLIKLKWLGYRTVKIYDNMLSRFHLIPERHGQTDRQTDGRTDGQTDRIAISISRVSVLTRDKNHRIFMNILNWMNVTWLKMKKVALDRLRVWQNVFLVFISILRYGRSRLLKSSKLVAIKNPYVISYWSSVVTIDNRINNL